MNDDEWINHGRVVAQREIRIAEARDYEIMMTAQYCRRDPYVTLEAWHIDARRRYGRHTVQVRL